MPQSKAYPQGLTRQENEAIRKFCQLVRERLGTNLVEIRLFGSKARGTSNEGSDIDLLVLTANHDWAIEQSVVDVAVNINLEYDVLISPLVISQSRYFSPLYQETLLFRTTQEEGIPL